MQYHNAGTAGVLSIHQIRGSKKVLLYTSQKKVKKCIDKISGYCGKEKVKYCSDKISG